MAIADGAGQVRADWFGGNPDYANHPGDVWEGREMTTDKCVWTFIPSYSEFSEDCWKTSCGQAFVMFEGTPKENKYNFCPSCGKELNEFYMPIDEDDELEDDCEDDPRRNGAICDCYICVPAGNYPYLCAHCGKMVRR